MYINTGETGDETGDERTKRMDEKTKRRDETQTKKDETHHKSMIYNDDLRFVFRLAETIQLQT